MSHLIIALIVFVCVFGSALLGLYLRTVLPEHHLSEESNGVVKLATGLIATMAALVLGLLISSAKSQLDTANADIVRNAASIVSLDRELADYGPETQEIRASLKRTYATTMQILASGDPSQFAGLSSSEGADRVEDLQRKLKAITPRTEEQHQRQAHAIQIINDLAAARWLELLGAKGAIPTPLLVVLVSWLAMIFGTFGLFALRNGTIIAVLVMGALSTSEAIFLILEMNTPLSGVMRVSLQPMRDAVVLLGR
jgi:hypothetical protein